MMQFSLAYIKNQNQFLLKSFHEGAEKKGQILEIEDLKSINTQGILIPENLMENEEVMGHLLEDNRTVLMRRSPINDSDEFEAMDMDQASNFFQKANRQWVISNNLEMLENLFKYISHLKPLFQHDRTAFFEELWVVLKKNLGAKDIRLVYNHMQKAQKEHEKNKLVRVIVEGQRSPQPIENEELGKSLMKNFEGKFLENFQIEEYNEETGKLVALAQINKSPVIIMADIYQWSPMQTALLKALFDGLQKDLH